MFEPWFKPKTHGYGAYPSHWKGWATIAVYALVMLVLALTFVVEPARTGGALPRSALLAYLGLAALVTAGLLVLSSLRTCGTWRWRWGDRQMGNKKQGSD
ncbi:MAG: hypothetical protein ACKVP7_21350 [Hyphomicrobiaceae bacterium]